MCGAAQALCSEGELQTQRGPQPVQVLTAAVRDGAAVQQCGMHACWQTGLTVAARAPEAHGHGRGQLALLRSVLSPAGPESAADVSVPLQPRLWHSSCRPQVCLDQGVTGPQSDLLQGSWSTAKE